MTTSRTFTIGAHEVSFETGEVARQAHGSVLVRCGQQVVLVTVVAGEATRPYPDFLPLTVEYREKAAAAARIPGGFTRREGKIADHEVLASRFIDRSLRPLFPEGLGTEIHVQASVLSADPAGPDLPSLALMGAGAALHVSKIPFGGPVGGLRLASVGNRLVIMPSSAERERADLDVVVAWRREGLVMLEGSAREVPEDRLLTLLKGAAELLAPLLVAQDELRQEMGLAKDPGPDGPMATLPAGAADRLRAEVGAALEEPDKGRRRARVRDAVARVVGETGADADVAERLSLVARQVETELVRARILAGGPRVDGRDCTTIRPITCRTRWLPAPHGSALFTRGQTQASVTCTLAGQGSVQMIETLWGMDRKNVLLHYNFPAFSVGEVPTSRGGPGRREVGHGLLALRALEPVLPRWKDYPYVIRIEADVLESNGSSSMATVCGASLALMDAGVPIARPVAGVAMGLVSAGGRSAVLADILGDEDALGDMDFKIAGTREGITALQLDNKLGHLSEDLLAEVLSQARTARIQILDTMDQTLASPRTDPPAGAPRVMVTQIPSDMLGVLIGPKGSTIKGLQDQHGVEITVEKDGRVAVAGTDPGAVNGAVLRIQTLTGVLELDKVYEGKVIRVIDAGAVLRIYDTSECWLHVSEWEEGRVESMDAVTKTGDNVVVRILGVDGRGRIRVSRRAALSRDGEPIVNLHE